MDIKGAKGGCFRAGTRVQQQHGCSMPIETLCVGDEVLGFDEQGNLAACRVTVVHRHDPQPILHVRFWNGEVFATPNHWVLNQYGSFVEIRTLTVDDAVMDGMGHLRPIISMVMLPEPEPVFNLTVEPLHTFIANGIRVHNGGHRAGYPEIKGAKGGSKGGGGGHVPVESPDSLHSRQYARVIDLVSEGEIEGLVGGLQGVLLDGTPIQNSDGSMNFSGVTIDTRKGTQEQPYMAGFPLVENEVAVSTEVTYAVPVVRQLTNQNIDAVRVTLEIPALSYQNPTNGDLGGTTVQIAIDVQSNGGGWVPAKLRTVDTAMAVAGLTAHSNGAGILSASFGLVWSGAASLSMQYCYWAMEVRAYGSSDPWVQFASGVMSGSGSYVPDPAYWAMDGNYYKNLTGGDGGGSYYVMVSYEEYAAATTVIGAPSGSATATYNAPAEAAYEFRAVMSSGTGSLAFGSATAHTWDGSDIISGKTTSRYQRNYRVPLTGEGPWDIRMRRLTSDATQTNLQNQTWFDSYTEIIDAKLSYPNSALVGVQVDSSQFRSIPRRGYHIKGIRVRVPSNYNPETRTYTGVWDGTFTVAWSNNPAWCFYDIVTSTRYGLGDMIDATQVDKWALYDIAKYCDELVSDGFGGMEPRFTCNMYMQTREEAYKVINTMASVFRGIAWWQSGSITTSADKPADAVMPFTPANVVDGMFTYQGASLKARHTVALVTWNDPADQYRQKPEYVEDLEGIRLYGVRQTDVLAAGCTSRGQAHRLGRWILYSERLETETVSFKCGMDGTYLAPGSIIETQDPVRAGERFGGRVVTATVVSVTIDAPVTIEAGKAYTLSVVLPDGSFETKAVTNAPGTVTTLSVDPLTVAPQDDAMWVLASDSLKPEMWRVVAIAEGEKGVLEVTALAHRPDKYDAVENNLVLEPLPVSGVSLTPSAPTGLQASDFTYADGNLYRTRMTFGWNQVKDAVQYRVTYRAGADNTTILDGVLTNSVVIDGVREEEYVLTVATVNALGSSSALATLNYTVLGLKAPPQDVTGLIITRRTYDLLIEWNPVSDVDLTGYEVRVGPSWDAGTVLTTGMMGTAFIHDQDNAGTYYYHVRAIDGYGAYSANVSTFTLVLDPPTTVEQFDCVQSGGRIEFRWLANPEPNIAYYEIREGTEWTTATLIGQSNSTTYSTPAGAAGARNFLIKAVATPGVYSDIATFVTTDIAQPTDRNMLVSSDRTALGYPGIDHALTEVGTTLTLDVGKQQGEYLFGIDLGVSYRAQVTVMTENDAINPNFYTEVPYGVVGYMLNDRDYVGYVTENRTWANSLFTWADTEALTPWTPAGDSTRVNTKVQLATQQGLAAGESDGWTLDNTLVSVNGITPATAVDVTYATGRYNPGVFVGDMTKVSWNVGVPAVFRHSFWYSPEMLTNTVILRMEGTGIELVVRYSADSGVLYLEDGMLRKVEIPVSLNAGEQYLIMVAQGTAERKLAVADMSGALALIAAGNYGPEGSFSSLRLH